MHILEEAPPLNPWPFLIGDVALIGTACFIANDAETPLSGAPLLGIVACVVFGAILAVIPFLLNHARREAAVLAVRQREITALAQAVANSAEQIATAAAHLATVDENADRAIKLVESLPHRLQDKINEFKTQLNEVAVTENEALSQEINTLRTSETERLESALAGVRKTAAEFSSLDASIRKQIKELNDALAAAGPAAEKSAALVVKAIEQARLESEKALSNAQLAAVDALRKTAADVLAEADRKAAHPIEAAPLPAVEIADNKKAPVEKMPASEPDEISAPADLQAPPVESEPEKPAAPVTSSSQPAKLIAEPLVIAKSEPPAEDVPVAAIEKPLKRRTARKQPGAESELALGLEMPEPAAEFSQEAPENSESAVSADGITRLLVTAYIGIGNKLYVRGEGPGLRWDQGVPLQFVSIGKWRWETADAEVPVKLKLYKNDEVECPVGLLTIAPGHQQEVSANFG